MGAPDGNRDRGAGNRRGRVAPPSDEAPPPIDVCEGGHVREETPVRSPGLGGTPVITA